MQRQNETHRRNLIERALFVRHELRMENVRDRPNAIRIENKTECEMEEEQSSDEMVRGERERERREQKEKEI